MPSVRCLRRSSRSLWKRLYFSGTLRASIASTARVLFGLKPSISASDAALMWFGLAGFSSGTASCAAEGFAAAFVALRVDSAFAETVFAMARTSSRLRAIGLVAAFRARMLSRSADFLDGFSMVGRLPGAGGGGGAGFAAGAFRASFLGSFFLDRSEERRVGK